jgi:uncharacterized protein
MSHEPAAAQAASGAPERLRRALDHAAHLLPAQGPIGVFIHHNTLHAFQHLPFEEAVVAAARTFGTEPYLSEEAYRAEMARGRVREEDVDAVLAAEPDAEIWPRALTRRALRRAMLLPGLRRFAAESLEWQIDECGLLERFRPDLPPAAREALLGGKGERVAARELFAACHRRLPPITPPEGEPPARPREAVLKLTGVDTDAVIHPWLIRLSAVFLDQGLAYWPMPGRAGGFYAAARDLLRQRGMLEPRPLAGLRREFERQARAGLSAADVVLDYLKRYGVGEAAWEALLTAELLALPGWAGLMRQLEEDPSLAPHEPVPCSLMDFLAVRLTLGAVAAENAWKPLACARVGVGVGVPGPLREAWRAALPPAPGGETERLAAAAELFDVAQLLGLSAGQVNSLSAAEFDRLRQEIRDFDGFERRRVLHLAYERRHERLTLDPLARHRRDVDPARREMTPSAQVVFCIDEREESIRRALEEAAPDVETFGAAGFFGVAVNYQGLDDPHGVALCPVVVKPQHAVKEKPVGEHAGLHARRQSLRRTWAALAHNCYVGSRTLARGWAGTVGFGLLSLFPLVTRVLAPRRAGRLYAWLGERFLPEPRTELTLMRHDAAGHDKAEGLLVGFTVREKAERVAGVLKPAGLGRGLARLVVVLGHGSTSLNNPHESARDCGARGGRRGGPNARLFAAMANHPGVRAELRSLGVEITAETWFVGGYHDTCHDGVEYFDADLIPATHAADFERVRAALDRARAANALERSRRFEAAWADETPDAALRHVEERAEHLAEPRPEYGHATNAVCVVGRRSLTRGLFLDRRAFLVSYDPAADERNDLLAALLGAAGPVCAGINLEYYFSFVDNERYGCGTKLPHNVTGLVGVMDGHASDLRTGLPWQMVEVHEPVRLLLVVENTPERVLDAAFRSPVVKELIEKRWLRLAAMDPADGRVSVYRDGVFVLHEGVADELPEAPSSVEWYRGRREHLPIARVAPRARRAA